MRKRYVQLRGELVEVSQDYEPEPAAPLIFGDIPPYQSPITGEWIDSRSKRREDLLRNGCRPYEGREQEQKEIARQRAYAEAKAEMRTERIVAETLNHLPYRTQRILRGRA